MDMNELAELLPPPRTSITIDAALAVVAARHGMTPSDLLAKNRRRAISHPRQEVFWLAHRAGNSYPEIGAYFDMDHTSVLHGCRQVDARIKEKI